MGVYEDIIKLRNSSNTKTMSNNALTIYDDIIAIRNERNPLRNEPKPKKKNFLQSLDAKGDELLSQQKQVFDYLREDTKSIQNKANQELEIFRQSDDYKKYIGNSDLKKKADDYLLRKNTKINIIPNLPSPLSFENKNTISPKIEFEDDIKKYLDLKNKEDMLKANARQTIRQFGLGTAEVVGAAGALVYKAPEYVANTAVSAVTNPVDFAEGVAIGTTDAIDASAKFVQQKAIAPIEAKITGENYKQLLDEKYRDMPQVSDMLFGKWEDRMRTKERSQSAQKSFSSGQGLGGMIPTVVVSKFLGPKAGKAIFATKAHQSNYENAIAQGRTEFQANTSATVLTIAELALEGLGYDTTTLKGQSSLLKTAGGEFIEEFLMGPIEAVVNKFMYNENPDIQKLMVDSLEEGVQGFFLGVIMGSPSAISKTIQNKILNKEKLTTTEQQLLIAEVEKETGKSVEEITGEIGEYAIQTQLGINQYKQDSGIINDLRPVQGQNPSTQLNVLPATQKPLQSPINAVSEGPKNTLANYAKQQGWTDNANVVQDNVQPNKKLSLEEYATKFDKYEEYRKKGGTEINPMFEENYQKSISPDTKINNVNYYSKKIEETNQEILSLQKQMKNENILDDDKRKIINKISEFNEYKKDLQNQKKKAQQEVKQQGLIDNTNVVQDNVQQEYLNDNQFYDVMVENDKIVTPEERKILYGDNKQYVATEKSAEINEALRNNKPLNESQQKTVDVLDNVINKSVIKENMKTSRYVTSKILSDFGINVEDAQNYSGTKNANLLIDDIKNMIGKNLKSNQFISTSLTGDTTYRGGSKIMMNINVPAGSKAYIADNAAEGELILPRNANLVIKDVKLIKGENELKDRIMLDIDYTTDNQSQQPITTQKPMSTIDAAKANRNLKFKIDLNNTTIKQLQAANKIETSKEIKNKNNQEIARLKSEIENYQTQMNNNEQSAKQTPVESPQPIVEPIKEVQPIQEKVVEPKAEFKEEKIKYTESNKSYKSVDLDAMREQSKKIIQQEKAPFEETKVLTEIPKENFDIRKENFIDKYHQAITNDLHYVYKLSKELKRPSLIYFANNARQAPSASKFLITQKFMDSTGTTVLGDSLVNTFEPINNKGNQYKQDFYDYLVNIHNVDRINAEKSALVNNEGALKTIEQSQKTADDILSKHPEFKGYAEKVYKYQRNLLSILQEGGILSKFQIDTMQKMYPHYIPLFRKLEQGGGVGTYGKTINTKNVIKKAKEVTPGKSLAILPIDDSMAAQTTKYVDAAKKNLLFSEILDTLQSNSQYQIEQVNSEDIQFNENFEENVDNTLKKDGQSNLVSVYKNGKKITYAIDNNLYRSLLNLTNESLTRKLANQPIFKQMATVNKVTKTTVTTADLMFTAWTNPTKDIQNAIANTEDVKGFMAKFPEASKKMLTNHPDWQQFQAMGSFNSSILKTGEYQYKPSNQAKRAADKAFSLIEMIEQGPRFTEFLRVKYEIPGMENDRVQLLKAVYAAAEITINFGKGGEITKMIDRYFVPFLNPSIQGLSKIATNLTSKNAARYVMKGALMGIVPALLSSIMYGDDDEYEELNQWEKDNFYLIKTGNKFFKIPKGQLNAASSVFTNMISDVAAGKELSGKNIKDRLLNAYGQVGPVNPFESNIFSTFTQLSKNENWAGGNIVPQRLKDKPAAEQFDANTTNLAINLGRILNVSPKKIDHVFSQYTGGLGKLVRPAMTEAAEAGGLLNYPMRKLFSDPVYSNKSVGEFYDTYNALMTKKNSEKATYKDAALFKMVGKHTSRLNKLYSQIREIQSSKTLSDDKKIEQSKEKQKEINKIAREAIIQYKQYK